MALSIIELVAHYQHEQINKADYKAALEQHIRVCERKQDELGKQKIQAEDQDIWNAELKPGLEASYKGLIGAASEALAYAESRDDTKIGGIIALIQEVDRISSILEKRSGLVSESTREALAESMNFNNDGLSLENAVQHGTAESTVSFLDT